LIAGGQLMGAKLKAEYHFINSDRNFTKASGGTGDELGKELDLGVYYPFSKQLTGAFEYAKFTEGDKAAGAARKPPIQKIWLTAIYKF